MKADIKAFEKQAERGTAHYIRDHAVLYEQWKDKRVVSMLLTIHRGNQQVMVTRRGKDAAGHFANLDIHQPACVSDYNRSMGGVDTFDQLVETYRSLRRTRKSWKSIFVDMIDVAAVNSFRYFQLYNEQHGVHMSRQRNPHNSFRTELIRHLSHIAVNEPPPKRRYSLSQAHPPAAAPAASMHLVRHDPAKRNCVLCYELHRKELKCVNYCQVCKVNLHAGAQGCFGRYHEIKFP